MKIFFLALSVCVFGLTTAGRINPLRLYDVIDPNYNSPNVSDVHNLLWTRSNPAKEDSYEMFTNDEGNLEDSPFDGAKRTYFLIHGWGGSGTDGYLMEIKDLLLEWSDCQVISIDYETAASAANYDKAVSNMYYVAHYSASFIDFLVDSTVQETVQIHITGHSLGGQLCGMVAQYVTTGVIDRVTSLDPAGPLFYTKPDSERLDPTDADFVDVIHTNGCGVEDSCYGMFQATGDVDFYPNGGRHQAGCVAATDFFSGCSHARSHDYWIESLKAPLDENFQKQFWSVKCIDYDTYKITECEDYAETVVMGFRASRNLKGSFYLYTNEESPFAQG